MKTEEGRLKETVKKHLKRLGAHYYMPVPSGYGKQTLDFLCCVSGRFVGIETKAPGKQPTPRQYLSMGEIQAAGGVAIWCDSEERFLDGLRLHGFISAQSSCAPKR